jgi:sigma-B regulation protein RsbU (phosphoserine phosphatase)
VLSGLAGGWDDIKKTLEQVRRELRADEASLLLLDGSGTLLVPVATSGLRRRARAGFRVPLGTGFAGQVAATGKPLILTDVNTQTVLNPVILQRGIESLLGVPVPGRHELMGVVHVGTTERRMFGDEDVECLQEFARRLSAQVLRRRASEEHVAALTIQRSLLPGAMPRIQGLDMDARYIPADSDLGGDWYDVFEFPDHRVGVVMGDVTGHGLEAAVVMGRLRSALRAYALEHRDPAEVLTLLDAKISHFEAGALATVLYAVAEPPYATFTVSSAGHLPPIRITAGDPAQLLELDSDPPVGIGGSWLRHSTIIDLPVGSSLCLYTDGLVERRPAGNLTTTDQLADGTAHLLRALRPGPSAGACNAVIEELLGEVLPDDDIALLILHRTAPKHEGASPANSAVQDVDESVRAKTEECLPPRHCERGAAIPLRGGLHANAQVMTSS